MAISSRRQYTQVSNAIRKHYGSGDKAQWDRFIETLISDYSRDNPAFNADRFRADCIPNYKGNDYEPAND